MNRTARTPDSRSCAHSLERSAEALKRAGGSVGAVSLERARTPHTPQGRALKRRPLVAGARALERSSERAAALKERNCIPTKLGGRRHWIGLPLDGGPSGQNGRNGRELPVERRIAPHEGVNGNIPSIPSNVSTGYFAGHDEHGVTGGMDDG